MPSPIGRGLLADARAARVFQSEVIYYTAYGRDLGELDSRLS